MFPAAALCAALISRSLLPAGLLCAAAAALPAFLLTDLFHCLLLWGRGQAAWAAGAWLFLRETCVSLPLCIPVAALFAAVFRRPIPTTEKRRSWTTKDRASACAFWPASSWP